MKPIPFLSRWVLLGLFVGHGLTGCTKEPEAHTAVNDEVEALQKSKAKLENEVKLLREDFEKRYREILKRNEELQKDTDAAKAGVEKAQDEAGKCRRELQEYQAKYKISVRTKAKGMQIPQLETADKQVFQSAVVKEVTPQEVALSHSGGVARIPLAKLPLELQRKFLYDPEELKKIEEAKAETAKLTTEDPEIKQRNPNRRFDPLAVKNIKGRITSRLGDIKKIDSEATQVANGPYKNTGVARYRLNVLQSRRLRLQEDVKLLRGILDKELNG